MLARFAKFVRIVDTEVSGAQREKVAQQLFEGIADTAEFEDAPQVALSNSEQIGGKRLTRKTSHRMGEVPGFEGKRGLAKGKVNTHFDKLIYKYMNLEIRK